MERQGGPGRRREFNMWEILQRELFSCREEHIIAALRINELRKPRLVKIVLIL
jgi:hypothetical protein